MFAVDGEQLWLAAGATVSRMTGDGASQFDWITHDIPVPFGKNESISAMAVSGDIVAVATTHSQETEAGTFSFGDGIYFSSDGGENWTHSGIVELFPDRQGMTIPGGETQCFGMWFDGPRFWAAYTTEFVVMTPDTGQTWFRYRPDSTSNPLPEPYLDDPNRLHRYLHLNYRGFDGAAHDGTVWVSTNAGVNKSVDGGVTWVNYDSVGTARGNRGTGLTGDFAPALAIDPATGAVWVGTQSSGIDEAYLEANPQDYLRDGVFDSLDYDLDRDGHVDGSGVNGVSWTIDGGKNWNSYVPSRDANVDSAYFRAWNFAFHESTVWAVGGSRGKDALLETDDIGKSWQIVRIVTSLGDTVAGDQGALDVAYVAGALWVATDRGLARSVDNAVSFEYILRFPQTRPLGGGDPIQPSLDATKLSTYAFPSPSAPAQRIVPHIVFALTVTADVTIAIYDAGGAHVRDIVRVQLPAGNHTIDWDGRTGGKRVVANGVYLYEIRTSDGHSASGKMMVLN